ncbi:MAG: hypothetical protein IJZ53_10380 [Tyzzerella sp.]|nr:hypothetical protein [Tyzzerella sp.]
MKKNLVKRLLAGALALCMAVGLAGCGGDDSGKSGGSGTSGDYSETVSFSATSWYSMYMADAGYDLESEAYTQWVMDKFNVEIDAWSLPSSNALATTRLWLNGSNVPDMFIVPYGMPVTELRQYMNLGMLQPLPEDWKEKWPNIADMVAATGYEGVVEMNGRTYAIPHATFYNFTDIDPLPRHKSIHFRKDWAEQVGMSDLGANGTIKVSELKEYIQKVSDAGLCSKPCLAGTVSGALEVFKLSAGIDGTSDFTKTDSGYVWTPATDEYIDLIEMLQEWYKGGLLDPDAYVTDVETAFEEYKNGLSPAIYYSGGVGNYQDMLSDVLKRNGYSPNNTEEREKLYDAYGIAAVAAEDGTVYSDATDNYYTMTGFSPKCDEATMVRILDMIDYFCTKEGQVGVTQGIPGEDWEFAEDGSVKILNEELASGEYEPSPSKFFNVWGTAGDDVAYVPGIAGRYLTEQEMVLDIYEVKSNGTIFPIDMDYVILDTDAKKNYSIAVTSQVTKLVISSNNIEKDWKAFVDEYSTIWQPVLDDLNK